VRIEGRERAYVDGRTEVGVVLARIFTVTITFRVVYMLNLSSFIRSVVKRVNVCAAYGKVNTESFGRDFKLVRRVSMSLSV
jgi:hypothetical protein